MKTASVNFRDNDSGSIDIIHKISTILEARGIKLLLPDLPSLYKNDLKKYICDKEEFLKGPDLAIAIGGDGTFLSTARMFLKKQIPIFGINRGKLGFLTEFSPYEYEKFLERTLDGDYKLTKRNVMIANLIKDGHEESLYFFNDAVISKGAFSRIIEIEISINDSFFNKFRGDGLIISTPTGSTAYSLSAGGPIVTPSETNVIILNPVCPHSMSMRPAIIPGSSVIRTKIVSKIENLLLTIDGQEAIRFNSGDQIILKNTTEKMNLIVHPDKDFYAILREKLHWGKL